MLRKVFNPAKTASLTRNVFRSVIYTGRRLLLRVTGGRREPCVRVLSAALLALRKSIDLYHCLLFGPSTARGVGGGAEEGVGVLGVGVRIGVGEKVAWVVVS